MSNTFEPVGIAVVGCGNISDQYLTNLVRFPDVKVVACADIDLSRASAQAAKIRGAALRGSGHGFGDAGR